MRPDGMVLPAMDKTQSTEELLIKVKQMLEIILWTVEK
jgi:hypothetical protein